MKISTILLAILFAGYAAVYAAYGQNAAGLGYVSYQMVAAALGYSSAVPTGTTGSCSASTFIGGATAGTFVAPVCAGGTIILSGLPTAPHGYSCHAQDQTTPSDTLKLTANSVSSITFTATTVASDVIAFGPCAAF